MDKKPTKIIKRYQNRKLYDTQDSCYVTLEDIRDMIKQGDDVQIVDNSSKEDITSVTLAQIILEEERKNQSLLPINVFKQIIATGGEALKGIFQKSLESGFHEISVVKEFVDKQIKPKIESVQNLPNVSQDIRNLKAKIEILENKLKEYEQKK